MSSLAETGSFGGLSRIAFTEARFDEYGSGFSFSSHIKSLNEVFPKGTLRIAEIGPSDNILLGELKELAHTLGRKAQTIAFPGTPLNEITEGSCVDKVIPIQEYTPYSTNGLKGQVNFLLDLRGDRPSTPLQEVITGHFNLLAPLGSALILSRPGFVHAGERDHSRDERVITLETAKSLGMSVAEGKRHVHLFKT